MPGFDRTGPNGNGFREGRGQGGCVSQYDVRQSVLSGRGRGRGRGSQGGANFSGMGMRGRSEQIAPNFNMSGMPSADESTESLKTTISELVQSLAEMKSRLDEMESKK